MTKTRSWLMTGTVCALITAALAGIKFVQISQAMAFMESFPPPSEAVTVAEAQADTWEPTRLLSGTVRSPEHLVISAEMAGRVVELPFLSGAVVPKGAAILVLFDDDLQAQREALLADLNLVETQFQRNRTLEADSLVSADQLDTLKARSLSLQAQIAVLDARLSRMTVRAPFTGTLGIYPQRLGDLMRFGEVLTTLTGISPSRWIDFKVPQGLTELHTGDAVQVRDISGNAIGTARVIAVSDAYAEGTRTYDVRVEMNAPELRHGALVQVAVRTGPTENLMSVPARSVRWDPQGAHMFVITESEAGAHLPHRASLRRVEVRGERNNRLYIRGELNAGDRIADQGAFKLKDEILVNIQVAASRG
ncbi:MAG: efflux RND transporter periplasmic adaptor subunit [Luminiphilus sp.]|nr:efflux RND transporter periplasmic adaptor subunit [Luminiphilus sp.]